MKKVILLGSLSIYFSIATSQDLNLGLVGYYPFDGNANDNSTTASNGVVNGPTLATGLGGETNGAYSFDGLNDYISLGTSNRGITDVITISFWAKTSSLADQYPISKYTYTEDAGYFTVFNNGYAGTAGRDGSGSFVFTDYSNTYIADNQWHHIISVVYENTWEIWIDCQLEKTITTGTSTPSINNSQDLILGKWGLENSNFYTGELDEVRIYNRVLTIQEMELLCNYDQFSTITENSKDEFTIYPNPASQFININLDDCSMNIMDEGGKIVFNCSIELQSQITLDISSWERGVYFIQFITTEGIETKKLIIQ